MSFTTPTGDTTWPGRPPTGPVIAYRRWRVDSNGLLTGLVIDQPWLTAQQEARCNGKQRVQVAERCDGPTPIEMVFTLTRTGPPRELIPTVDGGWVRMVERYTCCDPIDAPVVHPTPSLKAMCGLWAHKQPIPDCSCDDPTADRHGAVGVVRLTGRAVEGEDGWLAARATIVAVVDHSGRMAPEYDVLRYRDTATMWAEWAPDRHGWASRHDHYWCDTHTGGSYLTNNSLVRLLTGNNPQWSLTFDPNSYGTVPKPPTSLPTAQDAIRQATVKDQRRRPR